MLLPNLVWLVLVRRGCLDADSYRGKTRWRHHLQTEVSVETKRNQPGQNFDLGPSLHNSEEINLCYLENSVCGTLGSHRKWIHQKWNILLCLAFLLIHSKHIFFLSFLCWKTHLLQHFPCVSSSLEKWV